MSIEKVSRPGEYRGYSERIYNEMVRESRYLYVRGNNLAIDIYRPARGGSVTSEPHPVILQNKRYQRRGPYTDLNQVEEWVRQGYVVAILDPRGAGASFGHRVGDWSREEALDGRQVVEWLSAQPYCSGKVGMWGFSYMGGIQYMIAATRPPHLNAIVPDVATIDQYFRCPNGVVWVPPNPPKSITYPLDMAGPSAQTPQNVDEDPSGAMLACAIEEHKDNVYSDQEWAPGHTFRNQYRPEIRAMNFIAQSAITYKDDIGASGAAIYNIGGWFDAAPAQALAAWKLWGGKVIIGPWDHSQRSEMSKIEHLRWFDYHLKNIQNGIQDEPPIYYYTFNAPAGLEWQFAARWPPPEQRMIKYYLAEGPSHTSGSKNDGCLELHPPITADSHDEYPVDYSIKVFEEGGVDRFRENQRNWSGDMEKSMDSKGLTFTSAPLKSDLRVTGTPVIRLWASSTSSDGYFFAFLEEIDQKSLTSHYITNGMIRAACRATANLSPWTDLGMVYHRCYDVDIKPLAPGQPEELAFDLYPISYIFRRGNRIRVTITGSLQAVYPGFTEDPPPRISIYHNQTHVSCIELPMIAV